MQFKTGDKVSALICVERTRKGGLKASLHNGVETIMGPITNYADVPQTAIGTTVQLQVGAANSEGNRIQFRWLPFDL